MRKAKMVSPGGRIGKRVSLVLVVVFLVGCAALGQVYQADHGETRVSLDSVRGTCQHDREESSLELNRLRPNRYEIRGSLPVPHPCHELQVESEVENGILRIFLEPVAEDRMCVQCVGMLHLVGTVDRGKAGKIEVFFEDEEWLNETLQER